MFQNTTGLFYTAYTPTNAFQKMLHAHENPQNLHTLRTMRMFNRIVEKWSTAYMPRKNAKKQTKVDFGDYYNLHLNINDNQKKAFDGYITENETELWPLLNEALTDGWKHSLSYDTTNDCFISTLTQTDAQHDAAGAMIQSRSDHPGETVWLTLWKFHVLIDFTNLEQYRRRSNWG